MSTRRRPARRMPLRLAWLAVAAVAAVLLLPGPAMAGQYVDAAVSGLANDPVYVSGNAEEKLTGAQQGELRSRIEQSSNVPIYVAVLPTAALDEAGGSASQVAGQIVQGLRRPGVYAVLAGKHFRAGSTNGVLPKGVAPRLATDAYKAHRDQGPEAVLVDFVDRVKAAAAQGGDATSSDGSRSGSGAGAVVGIALAVLVVVGGGALILSSRRKRREIGRASCRERV